MKPARILAAVSAIVLVGAGAWALHAPTRAADPAPGVGGFYTLIDAGRGSELTVSLDPGALSYGHFTFGARGVGLFTSSGQADVTVANDHSVVLTYAGAASLDADASLDFRFGLSAESGQEVPAQVRLHAQLDPVHLTGSAELWYDGAQYQLVHVQPAADPNRAVAAIAADLRAADWTALYAAAYSGLRESMSEADFVAQVSQWIGGGQVTDVSILSAATQATSSELGYTVAEASLSLTRTTSTGPVTSVADLSLLAEPDGWKWISLTPRS